MKKTKTLFSWVGCSLLVGALALHPASAMAESPAAASAGSSAYAPGNRVTGIIVDEYGEPLIGATVSYGTNGVVADLDGKFTLTDVPEGTVITVAYVGYISQTFTIRGNMNLNIKMVPDSQTLDDVVVIGYGVQKKSNVTGSISSIKSEDFQNRVSANAAEALQGKVSGVQVINNSGAPGASPTIRVRGFSSNGDSDPLYIVDGLKVESLEFLEPSNIESMEVLKDAASAAIYGAEAGNGVVLVTTKSGKKGSAKVTFDAQFVWSHRGKKVDVLNAEDFIQYYSEADASFENTLATYYYDTANEGNDTDWQEEMFETGTMQKVNLGVSGGSDMGNYLVSLGYMTNNGIIFSNKDSYKRFTIQLNGTYNVRPWLEVGTNNSLANTDSKSLSEGSMQYGFMSRVVNTDPLIPVEYDGDDVPWYITQAIEEGRTPYSNSKTGNYYGVSFIGDENPVASMASTDTQSRQFYINGMTYLNLKPFKGFVFTSRLGYRYGNQTAHRYTRAGWSDINTLGSSDEEYPVLTSYQITSRYYQWENFLNYNIETKAGDFSIMAGMSWINNETDYLYAYTDDIENDADNYAYMDYSTSSSNDQVAGYLNKQRQLAYFGRLSWSYMARYNFQFNFRADAYDSAYLDSRHRWGYFPSVSAGWTVSNESFFEDVDKKVLSYLKIRASWGKNGSISNLGNYMYASVLTSGATMFYNTYMTAANSYYMDGEYVTGMYPTDYLANENLRWEESKQVDLGIDFRMFNDRLSLTFDYYNKNTDGLLFASTPALSTGATSMYKNLGKINNQGFEVEAEWRGSIKKDFTYSIKANFATVSNKVKEFRGEGNREAGTTLTGSDNTISYFEEGYPLWYLRGYKFIGVDSSDGSPIFEDLDNDGEITDADRTNIGSGIPDFTYGVTLSAAYKGFDFNIYGAGSQGAKLFYGLAGLNSNVMQERFDGRWTSTNSTNATMPSPLYQQGSDQFLGSDAFVYDASFFKIKQIQLGYTLPKSLLRKIGMESCRFFVSLDNFFTFTSYPGSDPETRAKSSDSDDANSSIAIDTGGYPIAKSVSFGLNLSF